MKDIIKQYAPALLAIITIGTLSVLLLFGISDSKGNTGFFKVLGAKVKEEQHAAQTKNQSKEAFLDSMSGQLPEAEGTSGILVNEEILANDFLSALLPAAEDSTAEVEVLDIFKDGNSQSMLENVYNESNHSYIFGEEGLYQIRIRISDSGKSSKGIAYIYVEGSEEE